MSTRAVTPLRKGLAPRKDGREVLAEIKGQYHLGYLSTNTAKDGAWRKVEIRVKRPDLRIRSRKGYFGPYKPSLN